MCRTVHSSFFYFTYAYMLSFSLQEVFSMNKEDFYALPGWKQQKVKQEAGLF